MILDILWLLVLHWGLTEMAIGALLCSTQHVSLHGEVFLRLCSLPLFSSTARKEDFVAFSLKDLEKW